MSIFLDLCLIAIADNLSVELKLTLDQAIKQTEEGKQCDDLIKQYNNGLITFAEFRNDFITAALKYETYHQEMEESS